MAEETLENKINYLRKLGKQSKKLKRMCDAQLFLYGLEKDIEKGNYKSASIHLSKLLIPVQGDMLLWEATAYNKLLTPNYNFLSDCTFSAFLVGKYAAYFGLGAALYHAMQNAF